MTGSAGVVERPGKGKGGEIGWGGGGMIRRGREREGDVGVGCFVTLGP